METDQPMADLRRERPLSAEEAASWDLMVSEGRELRAPILAAQAARREANRKALEAQRGYAAVNRKPSKSQAQALKEVPVAVKRWLVARMSGLSFQEAGVLSGTTWAEIRRAKAQNEECRCAIEALTESSRELMLAKAQSIIEQSQDEGRKVSLAQTQVSMRILASLDRAHFGEKVEGPVEAEGPKVLGNGGFIIKLVADAAKTAEMAPAARPAKALVYTDV